MFIPPYRKAETTIQAVPSPASFDQAERGFMDR